MAKLDDCRGQIETLLAHVGDLSSSYQQAKQMLAAVEGGDELDLAGIGLTMHFGQAACVPVPMPGDRDAVLDMLTNGLVMLSGEIVNTWGKVAETANEAYAHCQAAAARAAQQDQAQGGS